MEIKSYIKQIPQPVPPPIPQKRITLDLSFEEFALIVASVGMCPNEERSRFFAEQAQPEFRKLIGTGRSYPLYQALRQHAVAADIIHERVDYK